ncbi:MAG: nitroreductase family protein [Thermoguttaceae bacterium]|jgi:nitroreductase/NAD-dependent dihydropyrimidine dehydrogenase PreA subunit
MNIENAYVSIDEPKCIGCGLCVKDCPANYLRLADGKAKTSNASCIKCGHCYSICPEAAVNLTSSEPHGERVVPMSTFDSETFLQALKSRRSVRRFTDQPVEQEKLEKILEAGRYAPTAMDAQDVSYVLLGDRQRELEKKCVRALRLRQKILAPFVKAVRNIEITDDFLFKGGPCVIVVVSKIRINAALASGYMELMAETMGLGVLYCGFFVYCARSLRSVRKALQLRKRERVVACLVVGYPAVKYLRIPPRKSLSFREL